MHGPNRTHHTKDCFELKRRAKRAKPDTTCDGAEKVSYKDLNAFVNAKVTVALNKAKNQKKKEKKVTINDFDNFCNLKVEDSSEEESDHDVNALANAASDDSDSSASRVESDESNSDDE
eukprot:10386839-Ditylum_brightwellii.AAC.1